jgi:general secretion pathway protein I
LFTSANPDLRRAAGFTLIEALAALVVLSVGLAAIGSLSSTSRRSSLYTERRLALFETARKIVVGMPTGGDLRDGEMSGVVDNHHWHVDVEPLASPGGSTPGSAWRPWRVALHVVGPTGASMEIDSIQLRKTAQP